jgi:hypothetical protein
MDIMFICDYQTRALPVCFCSLIRRMGTHHVASGDRS